MGNEDHISATDNRKRRALSNSEQSYIQMSEYGVGIVCYIFFVESSEVISSDKLKLCLGYLMKIHPMLRMHIEEDNGKWFWYESKDALPDLRTDTSHEWEKVYNDLLLEQFEPYKKHEPLWSLTFLPAVISEFCSNNENNNSAFIFRFHHSVIDGQGIISLMNDLQDLLSGTTEIQNAPESKEVPKPSEEYAYQYMGRLQKCLVQLHLPAWSWVKRLMLKAMRSVLESGTAFDKYIGSIKDYKYDDNTSRTQLIPRVLSEEQFGSIYRACKRSEVTIQCALQAASTIACCQMIAEAKSNSTDRTNQTREPANTDADTCKIGVSPQLVRALPEVDIPSDSSYVVDLAWVIEDHVNINDWTDEKTFWPLAKRNLVEIRKNKESSLAFHPIAHKFTKYIVKEVFEEMPGKRFLMLNFTNHGNCNFVNRDQSAGLHVRAVFSSVSGQASGPVFNHFITTLDNKLFWGMNYYTNITTKEMAENHLARSIDILLQACED